LRLAEITDLEGGNRFLEEGYIAAFNSKFAVAAAEKGTAFRRTGRTDLDCVFALQTERVVSKDNTVAIADRSWQLEKSRFRSSLAGCTLTTHEHFDGTVSIRYGPHVVGRYTAEAYPCERPHRHSRGAVEKAGPPLRLRVLCLTKKHANPLRQAEGEQQAKSPRPDRSRVNKTGQIDKLTTHAHVNHSRNLNPRSSASHGRRAIESMDCVAAFLTRLTAFWVMMSPVVAPTGDITHLLREWSNGDEAALQELTPLVYRELRRLADSYMRRERPGHTLQPTALIHEAYLKLIAQQPAWESRSHFYRFAAHLMREILIDHARARRAQKRTGGERVPLADAEGIGSGRPADLIALDEALNRLEQFDKRKAQIVELRFFGGMTEKEAAEAIGISERTLRRELRLARAWLAQAICPLAHGRAGS
jgi:RNA polymerase sigma-70 factor, ECF subfamily